MSSITLKSVPTHLLAALRARAAAEHRSLNQQAIHLLEAALAGPADADASARQVAAWTRLAGQWRSELSVGDEIASIVGARTGGRRSDL